MKRVLLRSSSSISSACKHSPQKPWHSLQCHTWHASQRPLQTQTHTVPRLKSPWPLPLQEKISGMEEGMHLDPSYKWWSNINPSFYGSLYSHPNHGFQPHVASKTQLENDEFTMDKMEVKQTKSLLQLAHLHAIKDMLQQKDDIGIMTYEDLLQMCVSRGVASSSEIASRLIKCLDDASLILILQDVVYLNPKKVAQMINKALPRPSSTTSREREEIQRLKEEKEEIDRLAHKSSRRILWLGFGYLTLQMLLIFRLTFWDLSWDVMEPIAYFVTNITLLLGYAFFMLTSKHPTYRNLGATLRSSKQRKLMKRRNFDMGTLLKLERQCNRPISIPLGSSK